MTVEIRKPERGGFNKRGVWVNRDLLARRYREVFYHGVAVGDLTRQDGTWWLETDYTAPCGAGVFDVGRRYNAALEQRVREIVKGESQ
jgi:hypothetical protein